MSEKVRVPQSTTAWRTWTRPTCAIALYLKQVPPQRDGADTRHVYAWGGPSDELNSIRGVAWPADRNRLTGPQLYDAHCAGCHHARAQGSAGGGLPPLFHTTTLGRSNTSNLVMVMLDGIARRADASDVLMPGFRKVLSDQQVATLGTYLSHRYGNPAGTVTAAQVAALRAGGEPSSLAAVVRVAMVVGQPWCCWRCSSLRGAGALSAQCDAPPRQSA